MSEENMNYIDEIKGYIPKNEQEKIDKETILSYIDNNDNILLRENTVAHMTSSGIITNGSFDKILFAYHKIYDSWAWTGGHNDGNPNLLEVAIKEAKEETGVVNIYPLFDTMSAIDVIFVKNHNKNGKYVGDHLHLNATYILVADEHDELIVNEKENSGVKWFDIDDVMNHVKEDRIQPVYQKLFDIIKGQR